MKDWITESKWKLAAGVVLIATVLLPTGQLTGAEYVELVKWVVGLYMGAEAVAAKVER